MAIKIALAGNPNCGKTTMFNALTGANQYVGNWPGVTVEKKEGKLKGKKGKGEDIIVTDLPGIYSLSPYTLEEVVSRDYVLKENPDVIIDLVDATNIERNLYLTTQLIETGVPVVIALNMTDLLEKRGIKIDTKRLSMLLDCPIVETSALKQTGLDALVETAIKVANKKEVDLPREIFSKEMEAAVADVKGVLPDTISEDKKRWYAVKFLENDSKVVESMNLSAAAKAAVDKDRKELETKHNDDMESIVTDERYKFIQKIELSQGIHMLRKLVFTGISSNGDVVRGEIQLGVELVQHTQNQPLGHIVFTQHRQLVLWTTIKRALKDVTVRWLHPYVVNSSL